MKSTAIASIITLFLISSVIFSQSYVPFPEENAFWTVMEFNYQYDDYEVVMYTVKGDTIVNEKQYKKVFRLTKIPNSEDTLWTLHCMMRQEVENKRIYFIRIYQGETQEKLGYNFDVGIGDTISLPAFDYANIGDSLFIVSNMPFADSFQLHTGEFRYVYIYESILQFGSFSLYVIEGIGDFLSPFPNLFYWDPFHQPQMTCLEVNNIYLFGFSPDPSENCGFDILSVNEVPDESKILIYPNPANKILNVESSFFNKKNTNIRIVNSIGIEVFSDLCQKLNKDIFTIEVSDYPNGIYFIIIKSANADIIAKKLIINH